MPNRPALAHRLASPFGVVLTLALSACAVTPAPETNNPVELDAPAARLKGERHLEYRVGARIEASPAQVWALLIDAPKYPSWNRTVISIEGQILAGAKIKLKSTVDPKRTFKLEVSEFEPERRLVWQDGGKAFRGIRTFTLTPNEDGSTQFTMTEALGGTMMGMIESKLPDFRPSFDEFAHDLKVAAEAAAAN